MSKFAAHFPIEVDQAPVMLLVGRDCLKAMFTRPYGHKDGPFAHHTALGWAIVGAALPKDTRQIRARCFRTACEHISAQVRLPENASDPIHRAFYAFSESPEDDLPGLSKSDQAFERIVEAGTVINDLGNIQIPLPFRSDVSLPVNRECVRRRSHNSLLRISKKPDLAEGCRAAMQKYIDAGHMEQLPDRIPENPGRTYYVPVFPVVQEKKNKTRLVFDSSAKYKGVCLNDCLLKGRFSKLCLLGLKIQFLGLNIPNNG